MLHALGLARLRQSCPGTAHALLRLARINSRTGDTDDACARIGEAGNIIGRCTDPVIRGGPPAEPERLARLRPEASGPGRRGRARRPGGLTAREAEVPGLLAAGHTDSEIAAELVLSVHMVERQLQNACQKIGYGIGPMPPPAWSATEIVIPLPEGFRAAPHTVTATPKMVRKMVDYRDGTMPGLRQDRRHEFRIACGDRPPSQRHRARAAIVLPGSGAG